MKLIKHFGNFLNDVVNIDDERLEILDKRVSLISDYLASAPIIGDAYIDVVPQGSMAHRTIIKPLNNHDFDADVLLHLTPQDGWMPKDYVEEVYKAFRLNGNYKDKVTRKNRCVTVQYANECHVDVVPFLELAPDQFYITNRNEGEDGAYEQTDPEGYTAWLDERNRITNGNLIKAIRLLKWLRDYKQTFTCKSVILNVLLAGRVNDINLLSDPNYYSDLPTTLVHLMEDLDSYLAAYPDYMPRIEDPTCPEVDYNHRWDNDQYLNFRSKINYYASKARAAYEEENKTESIKLWRELFSEQFAPDAVKSLADTLTALNTLSVRKADPGEKFIEDMHQVQLVPSYRLKIIGTTRPKNGFRVYSLPKRGNRVEPGRVVRFTVAKCTVPGDYRIFWKIKNRGKAATEAGCLRGEIIEGSSWHDEPTAYRGTHYVECYIVKDGICIAKDRQPVVIL